MKFPFLFKEFFLAEVKKIGGGMVNAHAHLDRAWTLTPENWEQASRLMEEKWVLNREIKKQHTVESLTKRFEMAIELFKSQGITACRTNVDADSIVGMLVVETAAKIRDKHKGDFVLQLVPQPLEGFLNEEGTAQDPKKIGLFEKACAICDVVGGLPSRDRKLSGGDRKHLDICFSIAKNLKKDVNPHIDQENNPLERDTEMLIEKTREHGWGGRVTIVHGISLAAQEEAYRQRIIAQLKELEIGFSVCPRAALGMKQHKDKMSPVHNSIAPVDELLAAGVNVSLGTDNISDLFIPNSSGDLFDEINLLADAVRIYDIPTLAKIATVNGRKALKI